MKYRILDLLQFIKSLKTLKEKLLQVKFTKLGDAKPFSLTTTATRTNLFFLATNQYPPTVSAKAKWLEP